MDIGRDQSESMKQLVDVTKNGLCRLNCGPGNVWIEKYQSFGAAEDWLWKSSHEGWGCGRVRNKGVYTGRRRTAWIYGMCDDGLKVGRYRLPEA